MNLAEFSERCEEFIVYMDVEKGVSTNTLKSYQLDLNQFSTFWKHLQKTSKNNSSKSSLIDSLFIFIIKTSVKALLPEKFHALTHSKSFY